MKNLFLVTIVAALSACDANPRQQLALGAACNVHSDCEGGECVNGRCLLLASDLIEGALIVESVSLEAATLLVQGSGFNDMTHVHILSANGTMDTELTVSNFTSIELTAIFPPELVAEIESSTSTIFSFRLWMTNGTAIVTRDFLLYRGPVGLMGSSVSASDSQTLSLLDARYVTRVGGVIETPLNVSALPDTFLTVQPADYVPFKQTQWNLREDHLDTRFAWNRAAMFNYCDTGAEPNFPCQCNQYSGTSGADCSNVDPPSAMAAAVRLPHGARPKALRCRAAYYGSAATPFDGDSYDDIFDYRSQPTRTGSRSAFPVTPATLRLQMRVQGRGSAAVTCDSPPLQFTRTDSNQSSNANGVTREVAVDCSNAWAPNDGDEVSYSVLASVANDWGETYWPYAHQVPFRLWACDVAYATPSLLP